MWCLHASGGLQAAAAACRSDRRAIALVSPAAGRERRPRTAPRWWRRWELDEPDRAQREATRRGVHARGDVRGDAPPGVAGGNASAGGLYVGGVLRARARARVWA